MKKRIVFSLLILVVASLLLTLVACDFLGASPVMPTVELTVVERTASSLTFDVKVKDDNNIGSISKIELIHGEDTVTLDDLTVRRFDGLLSNNNYSIRVTYTYDLNDGNGACETVSTVWATTLAKSVPAVEITNLWVTENAIKADLTITDEDDVGVLEEIKLVGKNINTSLTNEQAIDFDGLIYGEAYEISVTYKYDLSDGKGEHVISKRLPVTIDNKTIHQTSYKLDYVVTNSGCKITGYSNCVHDVVHIPETIDGYAVMAVGNDAFRDFRALTSVVIPEGVTSIGSCAFLECSKMHTVIFQGNSKLVSIGAQAFYGCARLNSVTIPENVTYLGTGAFIGCYGLQTVTFEGNKLSSIGNDTFYSCDSLTSIVIPEGVTDVGANAFYGCDVLSAVTIPQSVTYIGSAAFAHCDKLQTIYYGGTEAQWVQVEIAGSNDYLTSIEPYYFSATPQTGKWHFDVDNNPTLWKEEDLQ